MRINRETFDFVLERIAHLLHKEPTYMVPKPIEDHRQLSLTIYRLVHGCSFKVIMDIFGVSQSLATETFNNVIKWVLTLYDEFVCLPRTEADWAWGGFHVHVASRLKNYFSFKNKYRVTSMGLDSLRV